QLQIADLEARINELSATVEAVAVNRFTRSGQHALPLLTGFESAGEQAQVDVLIDVVNETSAGDFDEYDALTTDLADAQARLVQNERDAVAARDLLEQRREGALDEVERLKDVEADRLEDEAVQKALQAEQAERRRQDEAQAVADAEALRAENDAGQTPVTAPSDPGATSLGPSDTVPIGDDGDIDDATGGIKPTGGSGGGQTGAGGVGGLPGSSPGDLGFEGWLCPVQGPVGFGDTWGAPRSGGRSHLGVDMIGAQGLPVVAVVDGFAASKVNELGGNTVALSGVDGNRYYYAHLDTWGTLGSVTAGTVIGYVGQSGNAIFSVPHLHFEIHPGGGAAVNPYPTVRAHC
ncbi:MAG: peptidoglycan DD-metalloendopeptidase family protein, partial [Actinobacteria bacterium]|nr:peptidoglycan DD-metalloendopeptidase family protein [Actinomycetota bacterium]